MFHLRSTAPVEVQADVSILRFHGRNHNFQSERGRCPTLFRTIQKLRHLSWKPVISSLSSPARNSGWSQVHKSVGLDLVLVQLLPGQTNILNVWIFPTPGRAMPYLLLVPCAESKPPIYINTRMPAPLVCLLISFPSAPSIASDPLSDFPPPFRGHQSPSLHTPSVLLLFLTFLHLRLSQ